MFNQEIGLVDLWVGWSIEHLTDKTQTPRLFEQHIFSSNDMTCKIEERTRLFNIDGERFPRSNPNGKWWRRWLCRIKEHIWESVLHAKSLSTSALTSTLQMFPNVLHAKSQWTQTGIIAIIASRLISFFLNYFAGIQNHLAVIKSFKFGDGYCISELCKLVFPGSSCQLVQIKVQNWHHVFTTPIHHSQNSIMYMCITGWFF